MRAPTVGAALGEVVSVHGLVAEEAAWPDRVRRSSRRRRPAIRDRPAPPARTVGRQRPRASPSRGRWRSSPASLVCDEVVSALDDQHPGPGRQPADGAAAHARADLSVSSRTTSAWSRHIAHHVVAMCGGKVMEAGSRAIACSPRRDIPTPTLPCSRLFLSPTRGSNAVASLRRCEAVPPDPANPPPGCRFHLSCRFAVERCRVEAPLPEVASDGHSVACHRWKDDEGAKRG